MDRGGTRLILASASPRRRALLAQIGVPCEVRTADVDEAAVLAQSLAERADPRRAARRLAMAKAQEVASRLEVGEPALVLAADTMVVLEGRILNKPRDAEEAVEMLECLSGRTHVVITGVALLSMQPARRLQGSSRTRVTFQSLAPEEIEGYVRSGEPLDKAGAYGIQGRGALLVRSISGCYFNVVGLPLSLVGRMLKSVGYPFWQAG